MQWKLDYIEVYPEEDLRECKRYYMAQKRLGEEVFNQIFGTYLMTFFISTATLLGLTIISVVCYLSARHSHLTF